MLWRVGINVVSTAGTGPIFGADVNWVRSMLVGPSVFMCPNTCGPIGTIASAVQINTETETSKLLRNYLQGSHLFCLKSVSKQKYHPNIKKKKKKFNKKKLLC